MKKFILLALLFSAFTAGAQTTGYMRYDSVRFQKVGGNSEFILENGTRNVVGGVLTNIGNGRTSFVTPTGGGGAAAKTRYLLGSGQSNMNGNNVGNYDTLPNPKVLGWNPVTNTWAMMRRGQFPMGSAFPGISWSAAGYGTDKDTSTSMIFYFAKRLQEQTGDTIKVFLLAWGANSINNWLPGGSGNFDYIKTELTSAGNPKLDYFLWHQGESDNAMADTTYKPKFDSLIARFDSLPSFSKSIPIFIYTVSRMFSDQNQINQNQKAIASGMYDPRYTLVDMSDLPGIGDAYHFNAYAHWVAANKTMAAIRNKNSLSNVFRITQPAERTLMYNLTTRIAKGQLVIDSATRLLYQFDGAIFRSFGTIAAGTGLTEVSGVFNNDLVTGKSGGGNINGGTGSGQVLNINGTVAGNGKVNIGAGTTAPLTVDEATNQAYTNSSNRFGFGTTNPTAKIHVYESDGNGGNPVKIENNGVASGLTYLTLGVNGSVGSSISGWANAALLESTTNGGLVFSAYNGKILFQTGSNNRNTRMTIDQSGNLGLNVGTPLTRFHSDGTMRLVNLGADVADTTTYKPLVQDASGNVVRFNRWPSAGGSGGTGYETEPASVAQINAGTVDSSYISPLGAETSKYTNQINSKNYAAASGSGATWTATLSPVPASTPAGMPVWIRFGTAVSAGATLNVNSLGAWNIVWNGSNIGGSVIPAGYTAVLVSTGTQWELKSSFSDPLKANIASQAHTGYTTVQAFGTAYSAKTAAYTLTATDNSITADATGGAFNVTLPTAVSIAGREYTIKRINNTANRVTIVTTSSQTIDGSTTYILYGQNDAVKVKSNGANWIIVDEKNTQRVIDATTATGITNVDAVTATNQWATRVGNMVTITFSATIDPTLGTGTTTTVRLSNPFAAIAPNFVNTTSAAGTVFGNASGGQVNSESGSTSTIITFFPMTGISNAVMGTYSFSL